MVFQGEADMSRIRSIHPGLFTDEAFVSVSMTARVFAPGLWTECDDHGVFEWKPLTLKMKIFPADNVDIEALLGELVAADMVREFSVDGKNYGAVRNFCKYQRPKKPAYRFPIPDVLRTYIASKDISSEAVPHQSHTSTENSPQMEDGGGSRREGKKKDIQAVAKATRPERDEKFEEFKKSYPRRKGANPWKPAKAQWDAALKQGSDADQIIAAVRNSTGFDREKIGTEYIPQAVKWLRDRRFEDADPPQTNGSAATVFIPVSSPKWGGLLARWREKNHTTTGPPIKDNGSGAGWYFPSEWVSGQEMPT